MVIDAEKGKSKICSGDIRLSDVRGISRKGFCFFLLLQVFVLYGPVLPARAAAVHQAYRIGAGDILEISVWKEESLSREVVVPPDLVISFPLVGDIDVTMMTVADLRREIGKRLNDFIPDATVTVMFRQINSLRAYVIGKVNKPGQFPINLDTTVVQLLAMAGGLNPFAAAGKIYILRRQDGKMVKFSFDYRDIEKGRDLAQNIILRRGDVVIVP